MRHAPARLHRFLVGGRRVDLRMQILRALSRRDAEWNQ